MNKYGKWGSLDPHYKGERGKSENLNNFSRDTSQEGAGPSFWLESCYQPSVAMPSIPSEQDGSRTAWLSQLLKWICVPPDHTFYPWGGGWPNHGIFHSRVLFFGCLFWFVLFCLLYYVITSQRCLHTNLQDLWVYYFIWTIRIKVFSKHYWKSGSKSISTWDNFPPVIFANVWRHLGLVGRCKQLLVGRVQRCC